MLDVGIGIATVQPVTAKTARELVVTHHYLHRAPPVSAAFGLVLESGEVVGVCVFGVPASRHLQKSACPSDPAKVIELNRLWLRDELVRNCASWFVGQCLRSLPPYIVVSYADTAVGHQGYVYRACNFFYAGWTDMERATPRFDYVVPGKHSRQAFRGGEATFTERVRRKPKVRYWTVTGTRRDKNTLADLCGWPKMSWKDQPPPGEEK